MVTSGTAPLMVYAFRRVRRGTSTEAFPDRRRRTRQSAATIRGATPDMTSGRADADHAGARPYQAAGARPSKKIQRQGIEAYVALTLR